MVDVVNIHTRDRLAILERSLPKWDQVSKPSTIINIVVEPQEVQVHREFLADMGLQDRITVVRIPKRNLGMGNSRHVGYLAARRLGARSFITTDDDLVPRQGPEHLLALARRPSVFGVGAHLSIYSLILGLEAGTGLHATAFGFRCWAMNTRKVQLLGGMPVAFKGYDDHEVCRQGMERFRLPWFVDTDTTIASIGKIGDPGGMSSLPGMSSLFNRKHTAHVLSHQRWPQFVNDPAPCEGRGTCSYRMSWKKFMATNGIDLEAW